jgi:integrase/recombinase XerD
MKDILVVNKIKELPLPANSNYRSDVEKFNYWLKSNNKNFSKDSLENYFKHLESEGLKPSTIRRYKSSLRKTTKELLGDSLTRLQDESINAFFRTIRLTDNKDEKGITENKILSPDELKSLIKISGKKTSVIIQSLFETACRVSELCNIRLSNCKRYKNGIEIRIIGKGNKSRNVFMSNDLYRTIRETYKGKKYLFEHDNKPLSRITVNTLIKRAGGKIGRDDIHAHTIRHTYASLNIQRLGLPKISKYLGHSNMQITHSFYLHGKASLDEVLSNTDDILRGSNG